MEKERERNISMWLALLCPQLGTWPTTQACALTGDRTSGPLVSRPALTGGQWSTEPHQPGCLHSCFTLFNKCLLSTRYMPGTVLGIRDMELYKSDLSLPPWTSQCTRKDIMWKLTIKQLFDYICDKCHESEVPDAGREYKGPDPGWASFRK